jgi:hypothetical protein
VGGVFSQAEGFASLNELWVGLAFHAVVTALGTGLLGKSIGARATVPAGTMTDRA